MMKNIRPDTFREASHSYASKKLWVQLIIFIVVFIIIYILESIVPAILSLPSVMEKMKTNGYFDDPQQLTLNASMQMSSEIMGIPKIMIPTLISTVFGTLASMFYCRMVEMRPLRSMGMRKEKMIRHYFIGFGVGALMMTVITLLTVVTGANKLKFSGSPDLLLIFMYFVGFFFQGMSEEFIFRGYLMTTVGSSHHTAAAVAISAIAFGLAHGGNSGLTVVAMINLILFGVFAAFYIIAFGDIWGACAMHSVWNFMQGNFYGISVSGTLRTESVFECEQVSGHGFLTGGKFGIEGSIFTTIVLAAALYIVILKIRKTDMFKNAKDEPLTIQINEE